MTENPTTTMVYKHGGQERQQLTAVWRNSGFSASYDSFVVGSTFVLRLNCSAKNPSPRQYPNRYASVESGQLTKSMNQKKKAVFNWSVRKDSALALQNNQGFIRTHTFKYLTKIQLKNKK